MAGPKHKRRIRIAAVAVAVLILAGAAAMHFAARSVKDSIQEALGPEGDAAAIKVGLTSIEILDVRIRAPRGWPSDSTLRARRIVVVPDLRELLSDRVRITRIDVEGGYLSALRPKEGGGLRVLPSIAERAKKSEGPAEERRGAVVSTVQLTDCVVEVCTTRPSAARCRSCVSMPSRAPSRTFACRSSRIARASRAAARG